MAVIPVAAALFFLWCLCWNLLSDWNVVAYSPTLGLCGSLCMFAGMIVFSRRPGQKPPGPKRVLLSLGTVVFAMTLIIVLSRALVARPADAPLMSPLVEHVSSVIAAIGFVAMTMTYGHRPKPPTA